MNIQIVENKGNFIELPWGKIWYKIVGDKTKPPMLVLHGGPGYPVIIYGI
jgi:proline iminopeptidase